MNVRAATLLVTVASTYAGMCACTNDAPTKASASEIPDSGPDPQDAEPRGACSDFDEPRLAGQVNVAAIREASGLVASRKNRGVLWTHNDSGDTPRIFAIRADGSAAAEIAIGGGAVAVDWEDLAVGAGPDGEDALFIGDIGDNDRKRTSITVYRIAEPDLAAPAPSSIADVTKIELAYEDGAPRNAEALLVDPRGGALVIVTKDEGGASELFAAEPPFDGTKKTLRKTGTLAVGRGATAGSPLVTGAGITESGDLVFLRTYTAAFAWTRLPGQTIADALSLSPCRLPVAVEIQGEAIAPLGDGSGFYTLTEGRSPPLSFVARK